MQWTSQTYDDLIQGILGASGWFPIHRALIKELGIEGAVVLQFLINFHQRVRHSPSYEWNDGWFYCTVAKLGSELNLSGYQQNRILSSLAEGEKPLVEFRKMGLPAKRHVRINAEAVVKIIIDWAQSDPSTTSDLETSVTRDLETLATKDLETSVTKLKGTSNKEPSKKPTSSKEEVGAFGGRLRRPPRAKRPVDGFLSRREENDWDRSSAGKLRGILARYGSDLLHPQGKRRPVSIPSLAKNFTRLRLDRRVERVEVDRLLDWLEDHYGDTYVPKIRAAEDFSAKWRQFVEARDRYDGNGAVAESDARAEPFQFEDDRSEERKLTDAVWEWLEIETDWIPGDIPSERMVARALRALSREGERVDMGVFEAARDELLREEATAE